MDTLLSIIINYILNLIYADPTVHNTLQQAAVTIIVDLAKYVGKLICGNIVGLLT